MGIRWERYVGGLGSSVSKPRAEVPIDSRVADVDVEERVKRDEEEELLLLLLLLLWLFVRGLLEEFVDCLSTLAHFAQSGGQ